jgi:trans-aconitate 2-methyltransferase
MERATIAGTRWDPGQYLKFSDHRLRPALELLNRVPLALLDRVPPAAPALIYDLGCGPGQVTRIIAGRWPAATVYGVDNSKEMLAKAAAAGGDIRWCEADVATWRPEDAPDLIYSNATLHWVGDHAALFSRLTRFLKPGGCLAVQMPLSWAAPSHRLMRETLANGGPNGGTLGSDDLRGALANDSVAPAATYYDLLADCAQTVDVWETEYLQILDGPDPVLEWVKSTGLRPVLEGLGERDRAVFLAEYAARLRAAYPVRADGRTLYPFKRLFLVATT